MVLSLRNIAVKFHNKNFFNVVHQIDGVLWSTLFESLHVAGRSWSSNKSCLVHTIEWRRSSRRFTLF